MGRRRSNALSAAPPWPLRSQQPRAQAQFLGLTHTAQRPPAVEKYAVIDGDNMKIFVRPDSVAAQLGRGFVLGALGGESGQQCGRAVGDVDAARPLPASPRGGT